MSESLALGSATHVVIGATNPASTRAFFEAFGFVDNRNRPGSMVRGLGHHTEIRIVEADAGRRLVDYDLGPRGLDLYTSSIERSLDVAASVGADVGPIGVVEIGPMVMKQVTVWGPDGIPLVLIENSSRRASLLDDHPDALHSEIHSLVWAVADRDDESTWWQENGATNGLDLSFDLPAVASFMRLPEAQVEVAMVMLSNEANDPIRFELLEFTGRDGDEFDADVDGTKAGIQAIGYDLGAVGQRLVSPAGVIVDR